MICNTFTYLIVHFSQMVIHIFGTVFVKFTLGS